MVPSWDNWSLAYIVLIGVLTVLPVVMILSGAYFMGRIGFDRAGLALDLNGLYHVGPPGRCYTPWSEIYSVRWRREKWRFLQSFTPISLLSAEGRTIRLFGPISDREWLHKVIELLIVHNQPIELLGKLACRKQMTRNGDDRPQNSAEFSEEGQDGNQSEVDSCRNPS